MITIRRNTFETNSSSTHSYSVSRDSSEWDRLKEIFDTVLYGSSGQEGITECYDADGTLELIKLLNEAQQIILNQC